MSLPHDPQQWQQKLNNKYEQNPYEDQNWHSPYEDQNWQDATIPPTIPTPPPPYTSLPEPYMSVYKPEATGFSTWSTNAKIATGSFAFVFLMFLVVLFIEIMPSTGSANTHHTIISTLAPTATPTVASTIIPNGAPISTPTIAPTPTSTTAMQQNST